jgi:hypothetical protein
MDRLFDDRFFRPFWVGEGVARRPRSRPVCDTGGGHRESRSRRQPDASTSRSPHEIVTITGTFEEETEKVDAGYVHRELSRGSFSRSFTIPTAVDTEAAKATFRDGLLTLTLPKTEEVKPKHIKVELT